MAQEMEDHPYGDVGTTTTPKEINTRIKLKRDTEANWEAASNKTILNGEVILVDGDDGRLRAKIGDGTSTYSELSFMDEQSVYFNANMTTVLDEMVLYTNVLPYALASGGTERYSATGYKENTRFSTSGKSDVSENHISITGYIPVKPGDIVRLKNITIPKTTYYSGYIQLFTDSRDDAYVNVYNTMLMGDRDTTYIYKPVFGNDGSLIEFTVSNSTKIKYIRIQASEFRDGATITINEPINNPNNDSLNYVTSYTNVLQAAQEADSTEIYNGIGYKSGYRIPSSNLAAETAADGMCTTGYIPYTSGNIVRVYKSASEGTATSYIVCYDAEKKPLYLKSALVALADINDVYTFAIYDKNCKYFRLSFGYIDSSTVITLDELIDIDSLNGYLPGEPV
jgi:hypothetical protein